MPRERSRFRTALALAAGLHALALGVSMLVGSRAALRTAPPRALSAPLVWIDTQTLDAQETPRASPEAGRTANDGALGGDERALGRSSVAFRIDPRVTTGFDEPNDSVREPGGEALEPSAEVPPSGDAPEGPHLSLDALGVGKNPFLADAAKDIAKPEPPARGIQRSLTNAIAKGDQSLGLGPEGPVIARLELETRQGDAPGNSTALFRATTDAQGRLVAFELVEANVGTPAYRAIAARVLKTLKSVRLRIPRGARGVTMDLRLVSHVELPSGHDPGMGVDVLGIPLKKPGGKKSPRVSILRIDPNGYKIDLPGAKPITLPSLPLASQLEIVGDPIDIGAPGQRIVRAHLERLDADIRESMTE